MTDGIGRIFGGSNYGVGGYVPQRKNEESVEAKANGQAQAQQNNEKTQVDPQKVMDFLDKYNYFIPNVTEVQSTGDVNSIDDETKERIAGYMEQFEMIYGIVEQEFGPELAPTVMDMVMDRLMGLVD